MNSLFEAWNWFCLSVYLKKIPTSTSWIRIFMAQEVHVVGGSKTKDIDQVCSLGLRAIKLIVSSCGCWTESFSGGKYKLRLATFATCICVCVCARYNKTMRWNVRRDQSASHLTLSALVFSSSSVIWWNEISEKIFRFKLEMGDRITQTINIE